METPTKNELRFEDSKIVVAPIQHFAGARLVRTTWFAGLAANEPDAEIQIRCPHTVKGHATTDAAVRCGQAMARRLPGGTTCPLTGRSAAVCDSPDHRNCGGE
jgi:hypothetical protein